ncbi:MAG TPA: hypothetical protein VGP93_01615 [Polyangiaceae bacterium]|nr:hypothetical protein [Polyangiaceae bacterium]
MAAWVETTTARAEPASNVSQSSEPHASPVPRALTGGALLLGVAYGLVLYMPIHDGFRGESAWLAVPVAGPTISMARNPKDANWALAIDQIAQLGGVVLVVAGSVELYRYSSPSLSIAMSTYGKGVSLAMRY